MCEAIYTIEELRKKFGNYYVDWAIKTMGNDPGKILCHIHNVIITYS